jgi:dTDP-4-dehydrorhamnose 3,5-epimerase
MNFFPTKIAGCCRVELRPILDRRGSFVGVFDLATARGVHPSFAVSRVNRSHTRPKGAIRGLHLQRPPMAEDKVVQCLRGAIFDVCVDMRPESPTYLQWVGFELSAENQHLSWVPKGCAHGFQTLSDDCLVEYFVDGVYSPPHESGFRWDDPTLGIAWPLPCSLTSERDAAWPLITR